MRRDQPPPLHEKGQRTALLVLSLLGLLTVVYLVRHESRAAAPYQRHQQRYAELTRTPLQSGVRELVTADGADRCPTCHVGILEPGRATLNNPYRSHPGALLKQHPPSRFLCTACHAAGGEHVDRCLPAEGDEGALGRRQAQASCLGCHPGWQAVELAGGARLTQGVRAYRRLGCGGCHRAAWIGSVEPIGPPLDRVRDKLTPGFVRAFLADPQRQRSGTAMPSFFSERVVQGAPLFTRRKLQRERSAQVEALVGFLLAGALARDPSRIELPPGDADTGRRLFVARGCVACHRHDTVPHGDTLGGVGPDLSAAAARLRPPWVAAWLRSPSTYNRSTRMPNPRLQAEDLPHLVAFLTAGAPPHPGKPPDGGLASRGRSLARQLGCPGCHAMEPLRDTPPVGPDLDGFGSKRVELLDFGGQRGCRTWRCWTELKLTRPLAFDRRPGLLQMPWQRLRAPTGALHSALQSGSPIPCDGELEDLVLVMRALTSRPPDGPRPVATRTDVQHGGMLVQELGCRQCHSIAGAGAAIREVWPRPPDRAPALEGEGAKVRPDWLHGFLRRPTALRPWLQMRMPRFEVLTARGDGARILTAYVASLDRASYPFVDEVRPVLEGRRRQEAMTLFTRMQCVRCHLLSNAPKLKPGELAPDLVLSGTRLRRAWIQRFILEPQKLMPGTRMPELFPLLDEDDPGSRSTPEPGLLGGDIRRQVEALTDLNLAWGAQPR